MPKAAPSFYYYVQLRCQCKGKIKIIGDKKCDSEAVVQASDSMTASM